MNKTKRPLMANNPLKSPAEKLREEAELQFSQKIAKGSSPQPVADPQRLLHELQVHQIELEMQNEELRRARNELEVGLERYTELYDFAPVGYFTLDKEGSILQVNLRGSSMLRVKRANLIGKRFAFFVGMAYRQLFNNYFQELFSRPDRQTCEVEFAFEDGTSAWVQIEATANVDEQACRMIVSDIRERKKADKIIEDALIEKETLLRELYRRTENNMHEIRAMLTLYRNRSQEPALHQVLTEIGRKIEGMALVQGMLYRIENLARIDLKNYIQELMGILQQQNSAVAGSVTFKVDLINQIVPIDVAIPVGMILNELISNAYQHAFPENRIGTIRIHNYLEVDGMMVVEVEDDGVGTPPGFDFRQSPSLGLQTIFAQAELQLQGRVDFISSAGLTCQVRFDPKGDY